MKSKILLKKIMAIGFVLTMATPLLFSNVMTAHAGSDKTIVKTDILNWTGSMQKYIVPKDGKYMIDVVGAKGGTIGPSDYEPQSLAYTHIGGKGGEVKFTIDLKEGQILYACVGAAGESHANGTPAATNGAASKGGDGVGYRLASGGGATELYLDGFDRSSNLLAVAGGGGGATRISNRGFSGLDAATSTAGNGDISGKGATPANFGGGGGGGYVGGTAGTTSSPAHGGSNYAASTLTINYNGVSSENGDGYVLITRMSNYQLMVDPNKGTWRGTKKISTFTLDTSFDFSTSFGFNGGRGAGGAGYTGSVQSMKVPKTGYYYIEAFGASGGADASSGGGGGLVKAYEYLTKDQTIYIAVGGRGGDNVRSSQAGIGGGWNGGAYPGDTGSDKDSSGGGGGCTSITTTNRGVLSNFSDYRNEVLVVAGGGSGGSDYSPGYGGQALYAGTSDNPSLVWGSNSLLVNSFGRGQWPGRADGGGGGGGWLGGKCGYDFAGNPAGGGASFVNTSNNSICVGIVANNHSGDGYCTIKYMDDMVVLQNPIREGYDFTGWTKSGEGTISETVDHQTLFTYGEGLTTLVANWVKKAGYGTLNVDPDGGYWNEEQTVSEINKPAGTNYDIDKPYRYGYVFDGWGFSGDGTLSDENYTFVEGTGDVRAKWLKAKTTLTVDPNGGLYNGTSDKTIYTDKESGSVQYIGNTTRTGYNFQYWDETLASDGYLGEDGWHFGTTNAYLKALWEPITYTVHYEPNAPEGLTVTGHHDDQLYVYDTEQALASNTEYDDPTGYKIKDVKFLWWNTKPDGSGITYSSGQVVKNLTTKDKDVITLYAQWMVKYTVNHYTQELDGGYTLKNTDEYWLIPLTKWTPPLHEYPGFYQPKVEPQIVNTSDTIINLHYDLIHYKLSYDLQGGDWYKEQSDGSWINIPAPPSEYTVLTPDIHIVRPDKVGYDFTGWTGTDVDKETLDVVIPKGSLGDRSFLAHWTPQAYDVDVPVSLIFSMGDDGTVAGVFDQNGDGKLTQNGYVINKSLFPVQVTDVAYDNNGLFTNTYDQNLDSSHANIMNWRLNAQNGDEWNEYAVDLENGVSTSNNEMFWLGQKTSVRSHEVQLSATNAWALHNKTDIKTLTKIGRIVWTFGIGDRWIPSRAITAAQTQ